MGLLDSEVKRIKVELGYHALAYGAEPYIGVTALFEKVIQPYLLAVADTTSTTTVVASGSPALVTLTLADPTGFAAFERVIIDVDASEEVATVRSLTGSALGVLLSKAHDGIYPVSVEGGVSMARRALRRCEAISAKMESSRGTGALKRVDEIEFHQAGKNLTQFRAYGEELEFRRDELAAILGVQRLNRGSATGGNGRGGSAVLY